MEKILNNLSVYKFPNVSFISFVYKIKQLLSPGLTVSICNVIQYRWKVIGANRTYFVLSITMIFKSCNDELVISLSMYSDNISVAISRSPWLSCSTANKYATLNILTESPFISFPVKTQHLNEESFYALILILVSVPI